jgi:hypothetical protein
MVSILGSEFLENEGGGMVVVGGKTWVTTKP